MRPPYHPSSLLLQDEDNGVAECVVIDSDGKEETETATERCGRRGLQERLEQRKKKNKNSKKVTSVPVGEKELQELIRLCEYEVAQDPYRGMGFLDNGTTSNNVDDNKNDKAIANALDDNAVGATSVRCGGRKIDKVVTPWDVCQWGILSVPKNNIGPDDRDNNAIDKNNEIVDDSILLDSGNAESLVRNLTESCCPSILAWTKDQLEESSRKKQQQSQKTRNKNGKKRNRSTKNGQNAVSDSNNFPRLGHRPLDARYRCPCDANPFCLGSMGGIVNELLKERCQKGITISIIDEDDESGEKDSNGKKRAKVFGFGGNYVHGKNKKDKDVEREIVDVDQNANIVTEETESEAPNGVFAFMGGNETSSKFSKKTESTEKDKRKSNSQTLVTTTASCKRLGPGWSNQEIGEPAEVFSSTNCISNREPFHEQGYSETAKNEMDKLRRFENVDTSKIKNAIQNIFGLFEQSNTVGMTMDEYIRTMTEWHKSLIFVDPTTEESDMANNNNITIALPPGIQNLGATCYLNTQLQCLAQIPVFLDGIFSWRPVNTTHKMNGVMTKLQKLLAQMLVGGDGKYTSLDFSNALGIQHNEQQDPNEFARLLFDRMEESFQQCSINSNAATTSPDSVKNGGGLGKLLHRIFHGTTTYNTICMKCGKKSVRSEGFMDLNLPIVHREHNYDDTDDCNEFENDKQDQKGDPAFVKRKRKKGTIEKAFERQKQNNLVDTDVQYCFDQYTKTEMLQGDNQYFCDACNSKQDAKRVMSLTELPPVLNIQLSRYVFDRKKFVKKKLSDKVRLPTILTVDQHESETGGTGNSTSANAFQSKRKSKKKYHLCAVMRHRGTSAYSGHYIAEAMDWTIGQWYEFNDEIVKVLPTPSNSYVPRTYLDSDDDNVKSAIKSAGSEDAYNMYYVDEEYMAEKAIITMSRNQRLNSIQNGSTKIQPAEIDVLSTLIREKIDRHSVLTELCYIDYAISERLRRRKNGIRKYMFVDPSSLLLQEGRVKDGKEPYYWVDGNTLRQFLACDRSLDNKLSSGEAMVCPASLLCSHGCLHPRIARRGKLLRKTLYDSYISLLSGERKFVSAKSGAKESDVVGCVITSRGEMTCHDCSTSYRKELSEKLDFLRIVYGLYLDILDETTDSTKGIKRDSGNEVAQEEYAYIVARSTITKFKKVVLDLMKSVAGFAKGGYPNNSSAKLDPKNNFVFDGIEDIDMSFFPGSPTYRARAVENTAGSTTMNDGIDEKFNSKITCPHGNCNDFSLRVVRYVPYKTWTKIKEVFPNAIEHKILMYTVDGVVRKPNIDDDGCLHCRMDKDAIMNLTSDIERWAKETKGNFALKNLLDGKKISVGEIAIHNFDSAQSNCRLVHRDDITNFCKSVRLLVRLSKLRMSEYSELKNYVEKIAFPSYHSVVLDFEKQSNARLLQSIRSLTCCEHKRVIKSAIFDSTAVDGEVQQRCQLSNNIAVLSDEEYNSYITALAELLIVLNSDYHKQEGVEDDLKENLSSSTLFEDVKNFSTSCHPAITMASGGNISSDEVLLFSLDGNSKEFSIMPGFCNHETCKKDFVPLIQKKAEVIAESVSIDSIDAGSRNTGARRKSDCRIGSIAMTPIIVESDLEDYVDTADNRQKIRVFECKGDSALIDTLQSLRTVVGTPKSANDTGGLDLGLRRSTRKRRTKFPIGCITCEESIDIGLHHNIAALRLLLFQNCQIPLGCKLSFAISLGDDSEPKGLDITFDESSKTLNEIIDHLKTTDGSFGDVVDSNPSEHYFLLYQVDKGDKSGDIEATLMDSFLQVSNIESPNSKCNTAKGGKKRKRSLERGFQGSLLQSSTAPRVVDEQKSRERDDSRCRIDDSKGDRTRARLNSVISDDEIDDVPTNAEKDTVSDFSDVEVATVPSPPPQDASYSKIGDERQMELVCKLIELTDSKDESRCFEAISWAIKSNPKFSEEEVMDAALSKLFG